MDTDTVKWPQDFSELQRIDAALKCGICYDYMKTSMLTNCSHSYCSLCVRKFLQYSNKCPTCFAVAHEAELRNNRLLDDITTFWIHVKDKLLRAIRVADAACKGPVSIIAENATTPKASTGSPKFGIQAFMTPPSTKASKSRECLFPKSPAPSPQSVQNVNETSCVVPRMFTVSKPTPASASKITASSEKAVCPVCEVEIPSKNINLHLDSCLQRCNAPIPKVCPVRKRKRSPLPKRLYHLMPDKALKKVLKEYKLNTQGERRILLNRIRRYTVLYNAETDEDNPRPVADIVLQVEREEREENKKENKLFKTLCQKVDRYSKPEEIEKANQQYISDNKDNFKKLIESMKMRDGKNIKPLKPSRVLESDEEGLTVVGGTNWDPGQPSTSGDAQETTCLDDTICLSDEEGKNSTQSSDQKTLELSEKSLQGSLGDSETSQDSVFDLSTTRSVLKTSTPGKKRFTKNKRRRRSPSPEFFTDDPPDKNLYESIFEDSEDPSEHLAEGGEAVDPDPDVQGGTPKDEPESSQGVESTPTPTRGRRKTSRTAQATGNESLATRRSRRTAKKIRSNSPT